MIDKLVQHINDRIENKLTESDISLLSEVFHLKKLRKHQYLIQGGDVCKIAAFVVKGALKKYTIDATVKKIF